MSPEQSDAEYNGECAFALSTGKSNVAGLAKHELVVGKKTYHFSNGIARFLFKVLPNRAQKADSTWAAK